MSNAAAAAKQNLDVNAQCTDQDRVACFVEGTHITTNQGPVRIEDLMVGEQVLTMDNGFQPVRWIGSKTVLATGNLAPVVFEPGAVGNTNQLKVSPQHRFLKRDTSANSLFGAIETLASAESMINGDTIHRVDGGDVTYFHILFDQHELVCSEGTWSESFHPCDIGLSSFDEKTQEEVLTLFPELRADLTSYGQLARQNVASS